jgi:transposase
MSRMRSYKIELKLSKEQEVLCKKSAGTARYAYNWMLDKLITDYEANKSLAEMYDLEKNPFNARHSH